MYRNQQQNRCPYCNQQQNRCPCCNQQQNRCPYCNQFIENYIPNNYYTSRENYAPSTINNYCIPNNFTENFYIPNNYREYYEAPTEKESIILIYADWCGHCKTYKDPSKANVDGYWENHKLKYGDKFNFYEVKEKDYSQIPENIKSLVQNFSIRGFPTILKISNGQVLDIDRKTLKPSS
jgi:thiol-disulfide isomerase/thioredoxin